MGKEGKNKKEGVTRRRFLEGAKEAGKGALAAAILTALGGHKSVAALTNVSNEEEVSTEARLDTEDLTPEQYEVFLRNDILDFVNASIESFSGDLLPEEKEFLLKLIEIKGLIKKAPLDKLQKIEDLLIKWRKDGTDNYLIDGKIDWKNPPVPRSQPKESDFFLPGVDKAEEILQILTAK